MQLRPEHLEAAAMGRNIELVDVRLRPSAGARRGCSGRPDTNDCDISLKFVGTPQQIVHSSTDVYCSENFGVKRDMWLLTGKVVVPSRCAVGHTVVAALVINRYGED
jgi:hypothetical protein